MSKKKIIIEPVNYKELFDCSENDYKEIVTRAKRKNSFQDAANLILENTKSEFLDERENFAGSISFIITGDEEGDAVNGTKKVVDYLKRKKEKHKIKYVVAKRNSPRCKEARVSHCN